MSLIESSLNHKPQERLHHRFQRQLKIANIGWRLLIATSLINAGYSARGVEASTAETFFVSGSQVIQEIGSTSSPIQSSEVGDASTSGTVVYNINNEISRKQTTGNTDSDPNYLANNTYNCALVLDANLVTNYPSNNSGRSVEQDILTLDQNIRTDLANNDVISPSTNVATSTSGFKTTFLMITQDFSTSSQFYRWDQPDQFRTQGTIAADGYLVPASLTTNLMGMKDQFLRDCMRLYPVHYSNVTSSNFDSSMSIYAINDNLKTAQVHTDTKVTNGVSSAVSINNGAVERGDSTLSISPNHISLVKERQRLNETHNFSQNPYESYNQTFDFKNTQFNLIPIDTSNSDRTFDPSLTRIIIPTAVPANGKSGKTISATNLRTVASLSSPYGYEIFDSLGSSLEDLDPRTAIAYIGFNVGTASEVWGVVPAVSLSYLYRENINSGTGQTPTSMDIRVKTYPSSGSIDSDYLNIRSSNVALSTINTPTPTQTTTSTETQTNTVTITVTNSPTSSETTSSTPTPSTIISPTESETASATTTSTASETSTATASSTITGTETSSATTTTTSTASETSTTTITATVTTTNTITSTASVTATHTTTPTFTTVPPSNGGGGSGGGGGNGGVVPLPVATSTSERTTTATWTSTPTRISSFTPTATFTATSTEVPAGIGRRLYVPVIIRDTYHGPTPEPTFTPTITPTPTIVSPSKYRVRRSVTKRQRSNLSRRRF